MHGTIQRRVAEARETDGQPSRPPRRKSEAQRIQRQDPDRSVRPSGPPISFRDLAYMAFPNKTEANLAFATGYDPRTCRRWLADNTEPPAEALGAVLAEIMKRFHQRD